LSLDGNETINGNKGLKIITGRDNTRTSVCIKSISFADIEKEKVEVLTRFLSGEARVLPIVKDSRGIQLREYPTVVRDMRMETSIVFFIGGPKTTEWCCRFVLRFGGFLAFHGFWKGYRHLTNAEWRVKEQENLLEVVEQYCVRGQGDPTNSVAIETCLRKVQLIQYGFIERAKEVEATSSSSTSRVTGVDEELMMGKKDYHANVMFAPALKEHYSKELEKGVNIHKQQRQDREEREAAAKSAASRPR
jgi:hypothetical protein